MRIRPVMSMLAALATAAAMLPAQLARAQDRADRAAERPQIAAATAEAVASLRDSIERTPINHRVTVSDFLRRTGAQDELNRALQRAELVGGPRWVDDDTCQVQLEISGAAVAHLLEQLAVKYQKDCPASAA